MSVLFAFPLLCFPPCLSSSQGAFASMPAKFSRQPAWACPVQAFVSCSRFLCSGPSKPFKVTRRK
ncbi:uncharacterized protein TRIVIDRAFT_216814 [Trichoderma virens Gv29-8]|uniref:Secreted protein n=1 Tax=Hypocrea virens (strain Gv29-8 / FGSC 10586) TaxID=413071 RepID=G9N7B9_HYPVG|nr:uncharacterized protein TRIVIDRAFT_216814 [Trichoderma virens Gv29-8]EHK17616.1 hypothetical protein TRIVIDRAFT_216814 [Trichoderma virens Gv29-8]